MTARLFLALYGCLLTVAAANGATVYTYTGNTYDTIAGSVYDSTMRVAGSLQLAEALVPDLVATAVTPTRFTFSDGVTVFTESNTDSILFTFWTDSSGAIAEWNIDLRIAFPSPAAIGDIAARLGSTHDVFIQPDGGSFGICTRVANGMCVATGDFNAALSSSTLNPPGTWRVSAAPLPAAVYLFGTGLCILCGIAKRRTAV